MKLKLDAKPIPKPFDPVSFTVTCESQRELNFWGTLFNCRAFCEAGKFGDHGVMAYDLKVAGANVDSVLDAVHEPGHCLIRRVFEGFAERLDKLEKKGKI